MKENINAHSPVSGAVVCNPHPVCLEQTLSWGKAQRRRLDGKASKVLGEFPRRSNPSLSNGIVLNPRHYLYGFVVKQPREEGTIEGTIEGRRLTQGYDQNYLAPALEQAQVLLRQVLIASIN